MTAVVSNNQRLDGIAVEVQKPNYEKEELIYLNGTVKENYEEMGQVRERLLELLYYQKISCVAQSALQSASCPKGYRSAYSGVKSERFNIIRGN